MRSALSHPLPRAVVPWRNRVLTVLQVLERDIKLLDRAKIAVRPVSPGSVGHLSMAHPNLWKDQVNRFLNWLETK